MRKKRTLVAILVAALIVAQIAVFFHPALAATSVNEDFEDSVANGFTAATGTYSIVTDGTKVYQTSSATARAVAGDATSTNVSVQADVRVASWSASTGRTVGLLARYVDA